MIGSSAPEQDAECIDLLYTLYTRLGLSHLNVQINTIGDTASRTAFRTALTAYFRSHFNDLSEDSKTRLEQNPLRILDSKDPGDKKIARGAPLIYDFLNEECQAHFQAVQKLLKQLNIPFETNPLLVRGLDYYNHTVFEVTAGELGAQNSIAGGGRYDGLLKTLSGPDLPAIGFGTGLERIIQTMLKQNVPLPKPFAPEVFLIAMGDEAKTACFSLLHQLRLCGIPSQMDFSQRKLSKVMQYAHQIGAAHVIVIGENELKTETVELKRMDTGEKTAYPLADLAAQLQKKFNINNQLGNQPCEKGKYV